MLQPRMQLLRVWRIVSVVSCQCTLSCVLDVTDDNETEVEEKVDGCAAASLFEASEG